MDRRTKYEIYADLLRTISKRQQCTLTRASYGANLPVDRAKRMLQFLASKGFAKEETTDEARTFKITKRGLEYLETFKQMRKLFAALEENVQ